MIRKIALFLALAGCLAFAPEGLASGYIGNKASHKFHYETCRAAQRIKPGNRVVLENREQAVTEGYRPCGICRP